MTYLTTNTIKKHRFRQIVILLLSILTVITTGCDDDNEENATSDGEEIESAIIYGYRTQTPEDLTYFMGVYEEIPSEPDFSTSVELGPSARIHAYKENPYIWNGEASSLTKWNVDRTDLSLSQGEVLSLAGVGISGDFGPPIFVSETQAYFFALTEGKVVEFNPTSMEIVEVIDVEPLVYEGIPTTPPGGFFYDVWRKYERAGKVLMSVGHSDLTSWTIPNKATVVVFDPATKMVTYNDDIRMASSTDFFTEDENGNLYQGTGPWSRFSARYGEQDPSSWRALGALLKVNNDGTHDPDFFIDLMEVLDSKLISNVPFITNGKVVVNHKRSGWEFPQDRSEVFTSSGGDISSMVDLTTLEVTPFTALSEYGAFGLRSIIDDTIYLWGRNDPGGVQHSSLLRQNPDGSYTEVSKMIGGQLRLVQRLW